MALACEGASSKLVDVDAEKCFDNRYLKEFSVIIKTKSFKWAPPLYEHHSVSESVSE